MIHLFWLDTLMSPETLLTSYISLNVYTGWLVKTAGAAGASWGST